MARTFRTHAARILLRITVPANARIDDHGHDHRGHDHAASADAAHGRRRHQRHNVRSGPGIASPKPTRDAGAS